MNNVGLIGRYFFARYGNGQGSRVNFWSIILLLVFLALFATVFWFLAGQDLDRSKIALIAWLGALLVGCVNGYAYLANYRLIDLPNVPKSLNLWLQIVTAFIISLVFGSLVLWPFYLGLYGWGDHIFLLKLFTLSWLILLGLTSFGSFLFLAIRRIFKNAIFRSLAVIVMAVISYRLAGSFFGLVSRFDAVLTSTNFQASGYLGLSFLALLGFSLAGLELLFDRQNIKQRELPNFWNFSLGRRLVPFALTSGVAIFLQELLRLVRSATWQRKLIFYWLILALVMILAQLFTTSDTQQARIVIFATSLSAVLASLAVSYPSGQSFINLRQDLRRFPLSEATVYLSLFWSALLVNIICAAFFINFGFIFGQIASTPNYLSLIVFTFSCHILFFNLTIITQLRPGSSYYIWLVLCLVPLLIIPTLFYGQVPSSVLAAILGMWLVANWLFSRWQVGKILVHDKS